MSKTLRVTGVLMKADIPSLSKRVYPKEVLEKAAEMIAKTNVSMSIRCGTEETSPVVGFVKSARVEDNTLICDGTLIMEELTLCPDLLFLTPRGIGNYDPISKVVDAKSYSISSVALTPMNGWEDQDPCKIEGSENME